MARSETGADQPTLGKLLRGLRNRNGWTLKEMSDRSGIPVSTLSKPPLEAKGTPQCCPSER